MALVAKSQDHFPRPSASRATGGGFCEHTNSVVRFGNVASIGLIFVSSLVEMSQKHFIARTFQPIVKALIDSSVFGRTQLLVCLQRQKSLIVILRTLLDNSVACGFGHLSG